MSSTPGRTSSSPTQTCERSPCPSARASAHCSISPSLKPSTRSPRPMSPTTSLWTLASSMPTWLWRTLRSRVPRMRWWPLLCLRLSRLPRWRVTLPTSSPRNKVSMRASRASLPERPSATPLRRLSLLLLTTPPTSPLPRPRFTPLLLRRLRTPTLAMSSSLAGRPSSLRFRISHLPRSCGRSLTGRLRPKTSPR
eukprot:Amastigsp_a174763_94.p2 type:complete len:195 gc:universal Amastigsp_a174763_94:2280-1696(-)